jgi:hypothetical protein
MVSNRDRLHFHCNFHTDSAQGTKKMTLEVVWVISNINVFSKTA